MLVVLLLWAVTPSSSALSPALACGANGCSCVGDQVPAKRSDTHADLVTLVAHFTLRES